MQFRAHTANIQTREKMEGLLSNWQKFLEREYGPAKMDEVMEMIRETVREKMVMSESEKRIRMEIPIPQDIQDINRIFKENGHSLYLVGGSVRDAIMEKTPKDYDLATDALPDKVQEMLEAKGYKTLEIGKAFGIINVVTDSGEYEIATFREDIGQGRRPDAVSFTDISTDVKRRDLTINALFYDIDSKEVVDLVGGFDDIKNGRIRTVGNPSDRFEEDKLRIMRAIRFAARTGGGLSDDIDKYLKGGFDLDGVSGERIRDEFIKGIKTAKDPKQFLQLNASYGMFDFIFPDLLIDAEKFLSTHDHIVSIAAILNKNDSDALSKKLNELKYTQKENRSICFLVSLMSFNSNNVYIHKKDMNKTPLSSSQIKEFANAMGLDMNMIDALIKFELSITGDDAKKAGIPNGPQMGEFIKNKEKELFLKSISGGI